MTASGDSPHAPQFSCRDRQRLLDQSFAGAIEYHETIGSTNDCALERAADYVGPLPLLVLAERQTSGRGRAANRWWTEQGALTFSLLIDAGRLALPTHYWPKTSLMAGLAVCEALDPFLAPSQADLKWPNDVWVEGRKLCGILVEAPRGAALRLTLGIGVNVNNSAVAAPDALSETAVAMIDVIGRPIPLIDVLEAILRRLDYWLPRVAAESERLLSVWRARCMLAGRRVVIDQGPRRVEDRQAGIAPRQIAGICRGIDADGALLVETLDGVERCFSGVVAIHPEDAVPRVPLTPSTSRRPAR